MSSAPPLSVDAEAARNKLDKAISSHIEKVFPEGQGPTKEFKFLPVPAYLRYHPGEPLHFSLAQICFLSTGTIFLVANLSYYQPILVQMAQTFNVSYQEISKVPTLVEAGYAFGTLFMFSFNDFIRRRTFLLFLIALSATLTVCLALARSFLMFQIFSFLIGMFTISPQIIVSLVKDHTHPSRKSLFTAIVLAGYITGFVIARLTGGVIAYLLSWKYVYYFAFGMQYTVLLFCYGTVPDFPARDKTFTYIGVLSSMFNHATSEPVMVQVALANMALGAGVASHSITLSFLLGGPSFNFSTLKIGLFGLTEIAGMILSVFAGRVIDRITPWYAILGASLGLIAFHAMLATAGSASISLLIVGCIGLDALKQLQYVSLAASVYTISIGSQTHLNTILILSYYLGQLIGTAVGSKIFVDHGWQYSAAFGLTCYVFQAIVMLLRGPSCKRWRWIGY